MPPRVQRPPVRSVREVRAARGDADDYERAAAEERVGDHVMTPELVRGAPRPPRAVRIEPGASPAAAAILGDLLTLLWGEVRGLRDVQSAQGRLDGPQLRAAVMLADATTKALREERRQNTLDDWSRLTEEEIFELLPEGAEELFLPREEPAPKRTKRKKATAKRRREAKSDGK